MAMVKNDNWIRRFEVTDPKKHKNGFTVYKVTSVVFPKSAPEASTSVVVWKRYNDFKKLHESLKGYHKQCNISEELPQLCRGNYFKRFEENVIKDRINFALELLNFIGRHQILFTSDPFLQFFNNGYRITEPYVIDDNPELCVNGNSLDVTTESTQDSDVKRNGSPGEIWDSKSSNESVSNNCECSDEDSVLTSDTPESVSPIHSVDSLLSAKENNRVFDGSNNFDAALDLVEHPSVLSDETMVQLEETKEANASKPRDVFEEMGDTVTCHSEKPIEVCLSVRTQDFQGSAAATCLIDDEWLTPPATPAGRQDYLVEAAYHVGQAQKYEVEGEFEAAFCFYKAAIACLLSGVQDDEDKARRQAVKEKTNQYLQRAEKIYALHLAPDRGVGVNKITEAVEELKLYKVLKVVDTVMVVTNTLDDKCYVIKVLQKSPCPVDLKKKTIIPYSVPYMVKLIKYFENDNSIFLVLQYVSGGKLWDYLSNYSQTETPFWRNSDENEFYCCSSRSSQYELTDSENLLNDWVTVDDAKEQSDVESVPSMFDDVDGAKSVDVNSLEVTCLVANSQKLLNSVSKTLLNSERLTSNLSKELIDIESAFDSKYRLVRGEKPSSKFHEARRKRSRSAVLRPKLERSFSTEDISDSRPRTASNSVDRRGEWSKLAAAMDSPRLPESTIRKWAAELLVALETLHRWGVICRDLHPGNILLGEGGHILLTFQACWKGVDVLVSEEALAGFYTAPETMSVFPISPAADWWSFGALLHELLTGKTLSSCYPEGILGHTILTFPEFLSPEARSLLTELLRYEPGERLGSGVNGAEEIKCHPFFSYVDWQVVYDNC